MSYFYSAEPNEGCCFNGNVLRTCEYCGGSPNIDCPPCQNARVLGSPCSIHSSNTTQAYGMAAPSIGGGKGDSGGGAGRDGKRSSGKSKAGHGGRTVK